MLRTIRRTVLLAAAAGVTLLGLGLGQASAALPALPVNLPALPGTSLPIDPQAPTAALPLNAVKSPTAALPLDAAKAPGSAPSVSDVDVAGVGSGNGAELPHLNVQPNLTGSTLDGVTAPDAQSVPSLDKVADGSALTSLDAAKFVPELGVLQLLPQLG